MTKKSKLIYIIILLLPIFSIGVFALHSLSPSASPATTFHSLNEIYSLITTGTSTSHSSISTSSVPTATTSHSTSEIYALLANMKTADTAVSIPSSIMPSNSAGTAQGYTLEDIYILATTTARGGNPTLAGTHTFGNSPAPTMYTLDDIYQTLIDLKSRVSLNHNEVRYGSNYFGIVGSYIEGIGIYCEDDSGCNSGLFCDLSGWDGQVCRVVGGQWYPCTGSSDCTQEGFFCGGLSICTAGTEGLACNDSSDCLLYCDNNFTGTCTNGSIGDYCAAGDNSTCASPNTCGTNAGVCGYNGSLGSSCSQNTDCTSGFCAQHECSDGITGVSYCDDSTDCVSEICDTYNTFKCTDGGIGAGCSDDTECAVGNFCDTGQCYSGEYGTPCGPTLGCDSSLFCIYDFMEYGEFCSDGRPGAPCAYGSDCISNICDDGYYDCM